MKGGRTLADDEIENQRSILSYDREINGVKINYDKTGMGKNVVLLLPGALGSAKTDFMPQLENINKDLFTLIGWDPPGYGKSRPPARTWPRDFFNRDAEVAVKLMKGINYNKYSLMGWSDGGITAMIIAAKYPEHIKKLVIWGANSFVTKEDTAMYDKISDINKWSDRIRKPFVDMYGQQYFQQLWHEWIAAISSYGKENKGNICDDLLSNIKCPTLIIHGKKDPMVPDFHPENLHEKIKHSVLINYPEGKHNLHLKYYKDFNSDVEKFLLEPVESN